MIMARRRRTPRTVRAIPAWITHEFAVRGLAPPHCTPEALARALERERRITIEFQCHPSDDPGVYGLLYHPAGRPRTYVIVLRQTPSLALRRLVMFHELAHLLFGHTLKEVAGEGELCGYLVADADDAQAEAFAVGAMQYSFVDTDAWTVSAAADDVSTSVFGQFLKQTRYQP
jgi:IrrE N-terminal-like domain